MLTLSLKLKRLIGLCNKHLIDFCYFCCFILIICFLYRDECSISIFIHQTRKRNQYPILALVRHFIISILILASIFVMHISCSLAFAIDWSILLILKERLHSYDCIYICALYENPDGPFEIQSRDWLRFRFVVFNATFNNVSVVLWRSVLLV
jgi:hypothetical protein